MIITMEIPKGLEKYYKDDKFCDILCRYRSDLILLSNTKNRRVEYQIMDKLIGAFQDSTIVDREQPLSPVKEWNIDHTHSWDVCPVCKSIRICSAHNYCSKCGQRLAWN